MIPAFGPLRPKLAVEKSLVTKVQEFIAEKKSFKESFTDE
jgi:hypothetical protein